MGKQLSLLAASIAFFSSSALAKEAVTSSMKCASFRWVSVGGDDKAAIVVPLTLAGRDYDFQLDTGAETSYVPEALAVSAGLMKAGAGGARVEDVRIGGVPVGPRWLLTRGSTGTIGLDMLVGFTTVIDYPAQRLCITPTSDLAFPIYRSVRWTDAVLRDGKLFVPVNIGGTVRTDFFFDTGASLFPLSVDASEWKLLTGRAQQGPGDRRIGGQAWGNRVELIGSRSTTPISIASLDAKPLEVFTDVRRPTRFASYSFRAAGLFGNAALWESTVVLTLGSRPQFGVVAPVK